MAEEYGLTPQGFNIKPFEVVKAEIETVELDVLGPVKLDGDSVIGQFNGIFGEIIALLWQLLAAVNNASNPDTATDLSLDDVVALNGVTRLEATATKVTCQVTGDNQTFIQAGSEVSALGINTVFALNNDLLLTNEKFIAMIISIIDFSENIYAVNINNVDYTYNRELDDTESDVIDGLVNIINTANIGLTASNVNNSLSLKSNSLNSYFKAYISDDMRINSVTGNGLFIAQDTGAIAVPSNVLTIIQTPVAGWVSVTNAEAGETGRNLETDTQLRIRRELSIRLGGTATNEAIRARVLNVRGVTAATVFENTDIIVVNGLPAKSFNVLVQGGEDEEIANAIWRAKAAGIQSFGNVNVIITDNQGIQHNIGFSRVIEGTVFVRVEVSTNSDYPSNGTDLIKEYIAEQINSLKVGEDVFYQSLYESVYKVPGVWSAVIELREAATSFASANIAFADNSIATTEIANIEVIISV